MPKEPNGLVMFPLEVSRETERLFEDMISRPWGICRELRGWHPSLDLYETEDAFILEADLPGVKQEDVTIEIENNQLLLRGSRSVESGVLTGRFHVMERSSGYFVRRISLPEPVDNATITGECHDGVLRARFPKTKRSQM
ncbi:MAG TPA: Hsp20/alpha crystallin family protein [Candidatus Binatia bacterium]